MELFHGTRQRFDRFDVTFMGTGDSGGIPACWFTDNFEGARNHALGYNRNPGVPLVYRCELTSHAIMADHGKTLSSQADIAARLSMTLPVGMSTLLGSGRDWHRLYLPEYIREGRRLVYRGRRQASPEEIIRWYSECGIHGIHDWEEFATDMYLRGSTTIMFDFSQLVIKEVIAL